VIDSSGLRRGASGAGVFAGGDAATPRADRGETADEYWRKLKGEAPTAEETELFDRLVAAFKAMNPCHCPSKSKTSA